MGILARRVAERHRTKVLGRDGNDFGGALSLLFGDGHLPNARSTSELLGVSASSTWPHLGVTLKSSAAAATRWNLVIPTAKTTGADGRINAEWRRNKSRLEVPVTDAKSVRDRADLLADLKITGFMQQAQSHPFLTMLAMGSMWAPNVNFQFNGYESAVLLAKTLEAVGEAFFALDRDSSGMPVRMLHLPPHWVRRPFELGGVASERSPNADAGNFEISALGMTGELGIPPRDMMDLRVANPVSPFRRGSGDLDALDAPVAQDELASSHTAARFRNNGIPALLFMIANMKEHEKKTLDHEWKRDLQGVLKAGLTKFLKLPEAFDMKKSLEVKELQGSVVDMDVANLRQLLRDELLIGQRIPPLLAGEQSSGNRAMALVATKLFAENAVTPLRERLRAFWQARLFESVGGMPPEYQGGFVVVWSAAEPTDEDTRDRLVSNMSHHFSRAQILRYAAETPLPGDGDIYGIPNTMTIWNQKTQEIIGPPQAPAQPFGANEAQAMEAKFADGLGELKAMIEMMATP